MEAACISVDPQFSEEVARIVPTHLRLHVGATKKDAVLLFGRCPLTVVDGRAGDLLPCAEHMLQVFGRSARRFLAKAVSARGRR
jgi:hypothetical protein